ncbi:helix-turn-helix domain-containing protein [Actinocorallia longicatena]|uniref:HTH araC/xylS-type domain-containing protein n=1 Tax=Actinocorallia longicatena TaxID=111803 RepID=A0ABP6QEI6_9ACTN
MVAMFDSSAVPVAERADLMRAALAETSVSSVALLGARDRVSARLDVWQLGDSYLFRAATSPVRMFRTERQARREPVPLLALAVQEHGEGLHRQFGPPRRVRTGGLMGMDMTEPFEFSWSGQGASRALMMPLEQLDVPADLMRHAVPRLAHSPLYGLVSRHITELFDNADAVSAHPLAAHIAEAGVDLARALIGSLASDGATRKEAAEQTLLARVREHVRQNLHDPHLDAASIAAAHNISRRRLYSLCAQAGISLEQHIIQRRLQGVRADLSRPTAAPRSIEAIARGWGFRNITHFNRRFRREFGMSPREYRALKTAAHPPA